MGHPSHKIVRMLPIISDTCKSEEFNKVCEVCEKSKQTRNPFPSSDHHVTSIFELIHCDLWGPYRTPSSCSAYYFLTIVDNYSWGVWIYLLKEKKEVACMVKSFLTFVERQYGKCIKIVRSDNGTEFMCLKDHFLQHGIIHQTSCIGTPQQNGRVERKHRHILNVARSLRFQGNLPIKFWGECVLAAGYLINLTPSFVLNGKTPYEILHGKAPNYDHLRIFGSLCYAHNQNRGGDKFNSRSRRCVFVGYPFGQKGWKLFDLDKEIFFVSRDVRFHEDVFPFVDPPNLPLQSNSPPLDGSNPGLILETNDPDLHTLPVSDCLEPTLTDKGGHASTPGAANLSEETVNPGFDLNDEVPHVLTDAIIAILAPTPSSLTEAPTTTCSLETVVPPNIISSTLVSIGRGHRLKTPSVRLRDFVTHNTILKSLSNHSSSSPSSLGLSYPLHKFVNYDSFSTRHCSFLAALHTKQEPLFFSQKPLFFSQAMKDQRWREAMSREIHALETNETWDLTKLPPGKKALGCRWVYKIKYHSDGSVERFKAKLVVLGNHQVEGLDYNETYAPVAKMVTIRTT